MEVESVGLRMIAVKQTSTSLAAKQEAGGAWPSRSPARACSRTATWP